MKLFKKKIDKCCNCPHVRIVPNPDPNDSFCFDDVDMVCGNPNNPDPRTINVALRPFQTYSVEIPSWCALEDV